MSKKKTKPNGVLPLPPTVSQESLGQIKALEGNVLKAKLELADADLTVAVAEQQRATARGAFVRATQALQDRMVSAAKDLGLDPKDSLILDTVSGTFKRR